MISNNEVQKKRKREKKKKFKEENNFPSMGKEEDQLGCGLKRLSECAYILKR